MMLYLGFHHQSSANDAFCIKTQMHVCYVSLIKYIGLHCAKTLRYGHSICCFMQKQKYFKESKYWTALAENSNPRALWILLYDWKWSRAKKQCRHYATIFKNPNIFNYTSCYRHITECRQPRNLLEKYEYYFFQNPHAFDWAMQQPIFEWFKNIDLLCRNNADWAVDFVLQHIEKVKNPRFLSMNTNRRILLYLYNHPHLIHWGFLSANPNAIDYLKQHPHKLQPSIYANPNCMSPAYFAFL